MNEISCTTLQLPPESLTRGLPPPHPRSLCPQLNLLNPPPPPEQNSWVRHWYHCWQMFHIPPYICQININFTVTIKRMIKYFVINTPMVQLWTLASTTLITGIYHILIPAVHPHFRCSRRESSLPTAYFRLEIPSHFEYSLPRCLGLQTQYILSFNY
jgi:hypothetical protein